MKLTDLIQKSKDDIESIVQMKQDESFIIGRLANLQSDLSAWATKEVERLEGKTKEERFKQFRINNPMGGDYLFTVCGFCKSDPLNCNCEEDAKAKIAWIRENLLEATPSTEGKAWLKKS